MSREIKFRGTSIKTGQLVYGSLVNNLWTYSDHSGRTKGTPICEILTGQYTGDCWEDVVGNGECVVDVDPTSIGQYTGLKDKNGKEIYEGDIVRCWDDGVYDPDWGFDKHHIGGMEYTGNRFSLNCDGIYLNNWPNAENIEIIGNIYENPELL